MGEEKEATRRVKRVKEKVAYLKGLIDGADFLAKDEKARTVWENMLAVFDEVGEALEELDRSQTEIEGYLEAVDEDLSELEDEIYGDEEDGYVEMECPNCHETVYLDEDLLAEEEELSCPNCGATLYQSEEEEEEAGKAEAKE